MRRTAALFLAAATAAALAGATPALAADHGQGHGHGGAAHASSHPAKGHHHSKPAKAHPVTLTGTLVSSDTATSTITIDVQGGSREFHGKTVTLNTDPKTVVRRNGATATAADLQPGDHLSVQARRDGDTLTATRINADSDAPEPAASSSPSAEASDAPHSGS